MPRRPFFAVPRGTCRLKQGVSLLPAEIMHLPAGAQLAALIHQNTAVVSPVSPKGRSACLVFCSLVRRSSTCISAVPRKNNNRFVARTCVGSATPLRNTCRCFARTRSLRLGAAFSATLTWLPGKVSIRGTTTIVLNPPPPMHSLGMDGCMYKCTYAHSRALSVLRPECYSKHCASIP